MRILIRFLHSFYKYVTAFIVVASPLFFIPGTSLRPDSTYYLVITFAVTLALLAHIVAAFLTKTWPKVTRFEIFAYSLFSASVLLSTLFSRDPYLVLFGNDINPFSAASLLMLPMVIYLVRSLPDTFRKRLKKILVYILGVSTFLFLFIFIFSGAIASSFAKVFSGFVSTGSLALYLGVFIILSLAIAQKRKLRLHYKLVIGITALLVAAFVVSLGSAGDIRPNAQSSMLVAKDTLIHQGVFGIGAGDFARAWQLYRPDVVVQSPYFDLEFIQGSGTIPTFFTTIGAVGGIAFIFLVFGSILLTFRVYRKETDADEKHVALLLFIIELYFFALAWCMPFSFAVLVLWMSIIGFGLAKARLVEHHPHKAMMYITLPILALLLVHMVITWNKTKAIITFAQVRSFSEKGETSTVDTIIDHALGSYASDTIYRAKLENAIVAARTILSTETKDQEALKTKYLLQAQKAVEAGLSAVKTNPTNYQNYVALGRAYELAFPFDKEGSYDRAKKSYEEAIKLYPGNPYLYVMLARVESTAGNKDAVRVQLSEALKKKQNFTDALYLMSQLSASEQKSEEALAYAIEALKNAPNDVNVLVQAGLLFYGKKDYQDAAIALEKALQLDQNNANIAYFLALSLRDGGQADIAKRIGEELLKRNPGNTDLTAFLKSVESGISSGTASTTGATSQKIPVTKKNGK